MFIKWNLLNPVILAVIVVAASVSTASADPSVISRSSEIKALTQNEIDGLMQGKGMGLALAAELNGHPGPLHVLELADKLKLSPVQLSDTQSVFESMKSKSIETGAKILGLETRLDQEFNRNEPDTNNVSRMTREIGELRGRLRSVHLLAHLKMNRILSPQQKHQYAQLRANTRGGDVVEHSPRHRAH